MNHLNGWHPFESIRFDPVKNYFVAMASFSEQQKQLLLKQTCNR